MLLKKILLMLLVSLLALTPALPETAEAKPVSPDFVELAKRLNPSVVNIRTAKVVKPRANTGRRAPHPFFGNDFFNEFFAPFFGDQFQQPQQRSRKEQSLGTGFIISQDGFVLTNNHVVNGADEVLVKLSDGRELKAEIKGQDEKLDIALLKLADGKSTFAAAELGDSDALEVGEWVMAIGNPFGLSQTVTAGIVSAKGRVIGSGPYDDFIQTDASINPGNSGGPLFNAQGKVVGINTAIIANGQGIGFAIPINVAKSVVSQLKSTGKVVRGYMGINFQGLDQSLVKSLKLPSDKGALITNVEKDSPAEKAGLKSGDVIVSFDGKPVVADTDLPKLVAATPINKQVKVGVYRDGKRRDLILTVGLAKDAPAEQTAAAQGEQAGVGISVQELTPELARQLRLRDVRGVVVSEVKAGSPAEEAGVVRGDLVIEVNGQRIESIAGFAEAVSSVRKGDMVRLLLRRPNGTFGYVAMKAE
ncbi:DegQ family serine endoprotease [Trichlorobacter ammonificans]|uniref:Probable periplasmic serine endoprotease DegP-like n=1 Tax=Trichlorobacter ammonificans TaxID=2916410 RepID=A0ABM9D5M8_9BACT|nr:DegQ family serine endoprotease [Trichlorobacter ammonificans]CAH2030541.1 putative periplasmic serine endoprotease DegP-like [Trichlorobacter ammonificans]